MLNARPSSQPRIPCQGSNRLAHPSPPAAEALRRSDQRHRSLAQGFLDLSHCLACSPLGMSLSAAGPRIQQNFGPRTHRHHSYHCRHRSGDDPMMMRMVGVRFSGCSGAAALVRVGPAASLSQPRHTGQRPRNWLCRVSLTARHGLRAKLRVRRKPTDLLTEGHRATLPHGAPSLASEWRSPQNTNGSLGLRRFCYTAGRSRSHVATLGRRCSSPEGTILFVSNRRNTAQHLLISAQRRRSTPLRRC